MKFMFNLAMTIILLLFLLGANGVASSVNFEKIVEPAEHDHWVVTLNGVPVVIIRSKGGFVDTERRASHVAEHLEEGLELFYQELTKSREPLQGFVVEKHGIYHGIDIQGVKVLEVTEGDRIGYETRDPHHEHRHIDQKLVAEFLRAVLQDILLLFNGQEPTVLKEYGKINTIYDVYLTAKSKFGEAIDEDAVKQILESLSPELREELRHLVYTIPEDFQEPVSIPKIIPQVFPIIAKVEPDSVHAGSEITIAGRNFGERSEISKVLIGNTEAKINSWDNRLIKARIPNQATGRQNAFVITNYGRSIGYEIAVLEYKAGFPTWLIVLFILLIGAFLIIYKKFFRAQVSGSEDRKLSFRLDVLDGPDAGQEFGPIDLPLGGRLFLGGDHELVFPLGSQAYIENNNGKVILHEANGESTRKLENGDTFELDCDIGRQKVKIYGTS